MMNGVLVFPPVWLEGKEHDDFTLDEPTLVFVRRVTSFSGLGAGFITEYEVVQSGLESGESWRSSLTPSIRRAIQVYRAVADRPVSAPELKLVVGGLS
jgi:hypothetical protein